MVVGDSHAFPSFLTPALTQLSFQSHRLFFSRFSGGREKNAGKKVCLNRISDSQPPGHESLCSPLSHPGRANKYEDSPKSQAFAVPSFNVVQMLMTTISPQCFIKSFSGLLKLGTV